jgi:hypothetical protein
MRINSTVALTLILLSLMVAAGVTSAAGGYNLGREALKGIRQPDVRPNAVGDTEGAPRREEVILLKEADIIETIETRIKGKSKKYSEIPNAVQVVPPALPVSTTQQPTPSPDTPNQAGLPITNSIQGVTLTVRSVRKDADALVLDVNLQNTGAQSIKFLYSFMEITDDQGRSYSGNTQGLPLELLPNGQTFPGTISIPIALLSDSNNLTLTLADYPQQKVKLQLSGIPVMK